MTPLLARAHAHTLLEQMLLVRLFEEKAAECYMAGSIRGFLHVAIGQEAVAVGALQAVGSEDRIVSAYREHAHALVRGMTPTAVMAEMFGKVTGCCRGHGGSMHLFDASRRFYGGTAIVAGGIPLAVGLALADRLRHAPHVTCCLFGDGAVAEGEFHESLNLAALWKLPVLFLCENNFYAMGTALERHQSMPRIHLKGMAYGIESAVVDGMDVLAVEMATRLAMEIVRSTSEPYLLEARTYRFRAHSMYDPELYRPKEEVTRWRQRDPLATFPRQLLEWGLLDDAEWQAMRERAQAVVDAAVAEAEAADEEPVESLLTGVYAEKEAACPS
jgi:pyruvate dehydrogenase E1 component alpha subunit